MAEMVNLLIRYYGLCPEGAQEVLAELRDTKSLQSLTEPRAARAVGQKQDHRP